jgi:hypothetical protein
MSTREESIARLTETRARMAAARHAPFVDPRRSVSNLDDGFPLLLMPVRLETRFRKVDAADQLWVRIYPDDCQVDTFEARLSESEIESGRVYWVESWAAGGIDANERAAWRNLVASRGVGRSTWILKQFQPVNSGDKPTRANVNDVVLVIPTDVPPAAAQKSALELYWRAVWLADGDRAQTDAAAANLTSAVGDSAATLLEKFAPANLAVLRSASRPRSDVAVTVAWLELPSPETLAPKTRSWTAPAQVRVLPDRFVVIGYQAGNVVFEAVGAAIPSPLVAGPDPSAPQEDQFQQTADGELKIPEEIRWMVDFEEAVAVGMGIKIPLDATRVDLEQPIDRVIAIGVRLADAQAGRDALEALLEQHRYGRAGLSLVRQGTPTNNTETATAGYSREEDADAAYDAMTAGEAEIKPTADWWQRSDGQWLADALGIGISALDRLPQANGKDLSEARAMNRALWPATLGYAMETMLHPVFTPQQVDATRWFFTSFVSGRGFLPAVRIGNQPYGVLPIAALSRLGEGVRSDEDVVGLPAPAVFGGFMAGLGRVLGRMRADWETMAARSPFIGRGGDPDQTLLDVLGLHPTSVEFHQRYAESLDHLFNRAKLQDAAEALMSGLAARRFLADGGTLLARLGYSGPKPDLLDKFFFSRSNRLNGPLIDDRPLSETASIRAYTEDERNYLHWLFDAAKSSLEELRLEAGFKGNQAPDTLLYVLLRHALMQGYWDSSLRLQVAAGTTTAESAVEARREPAFIHVKVGDDRSESRLDHLYRVDSRVTGSPVITLAEHITTHLGQLEPSRHLDDQLAALDILKDTPTARLERCLAEHIDTASYRLDAWLLGLVNHRLASMRYRQDDGGARRGLYLGAYGWVEDLRRKADPMTPVRLTGVVAETFTERDNRPLLIDPSNGGHLLAPSITQTVTASVLRAGYLANGSPEAPEAFAVNLSSARVRLALGLIDGVRSGQPLGALLGYRFQRGLHEGHGALELDRFLEPLRARFPLVANQMQSTKDDGAPLESIEARNVVDGMKLVEHVKKAGNGAYPFGVVMPTDVTPAEQAAVTKEVDRLLEAYDSLADLAIAEGVHQAVKGNYDRVASTLDAYAKGSVPPEPEVIRTPRSGLGLTHRVGLHFEPAVDATSSPVGFAMTPRAEAQAAMNKWLSVVLPAPTSVACRVIWLDPASGTLQQEVVTQEALGLQPLDLVAVVSLNGEPGMTELDDRIMTRVITTRTPRADAVLSIRHTERLAGKITFFELAPLLHSLRTILFGSRPLTPTDLVLSGKAERKHDAAQTIDRERVRRVRDNLDQLATDVSGFVIAEPVDAAIDSTVDLFQRAARFEARQVGWGFLYEWRRRIFTTLIERVRAVVDRFNNRLGAFEVGLASFVAAPPPTEDERFAVLARLDQMLATVPITPRLATSADYETALLVRRDALLAKRDQLQSVLAGAAARLAPLISAVNVALPLDVFESAPFVIEDLEREVTIFLAELRARIAALSVDLAARVKSADDSLAAHDNSADPGARVDALQHAGKALLGESMLLVPELTLDATRSTELANARAASAAGSLTRHLTDDLGVKFPVDDWLHGVARVRDKMRHFEQVSALSATFGGDELALLPIQLPFSASDQWLALELDATQPLSGERLLYTAHYSGAATGGTACGLLLDEWTEVIPSRTETPAMAFHYDRPGAEPPQAWLLVTPTRSDGRWQWDDIVDAVNETLALSRLRTVEPQQIDEEPYATLLPATMSAVTLYGVSIAANLSRVNGLESHLQRATDG